MTRTFIDACKTLRVHDFHPAPAPSASGSPLAVLSERVAAGRAIGHSTLPQTGGSRVVAPSKTDVEAGEAQAMPGGAV